MPEKPRIHEARTVTHFNNLSQKEIDLVFHMNLGIVHKITNKYHSTNWRKFEYDELFNNGCMGLLHAIDTYDIRHPSKALFITYAYNIIRAKISHHILHNCGLIHIPIKEKDNVKYTFCDYEKFSPIIRDQKDESEIIEQ